MRLGRIGFDKVSGYLKDGMQALASREDLLARVDRVTAVALADLLNTADAPTVVDVRAPGELESGRVPGSQNIPLKHLAERMEELPNDRPVVVHCAGGYRSAIAASLLAAHGYRVMDLVGGYQAWAASSNEIAMSTAQ